MILSPPRALRISILFSAAFLLAVPVLGQAPTVNLIQPRGVNPGQTVDLRTVGGNLAGATQCWTSFSGVTAVATDIEKNGTDGGQTVYHVAVPPDAPLGVHGLRVVTDKGVSNLRLLLVDDLPTVAEAGGNNSVAAAQEVPVPAGVDGVVDNLGRDFFKFNAAAGATLTFEAWSRRLGSALDPVLFLYDASGRELAYADDTRGLSSDSQLSFTFATAGTYVVEVRDAQFRGSGNHFYRLRIGDFPAITSTVPAAVTKGQETRVDFVGLDAASAAPAHVTAAPEAPEWLRVATTRVGGATHAFSFVRTSDAPQVLEREPNGAVEQANEAALGASISGRCDEPGDIDYFVIAGKKDQQFRFIGMTREIGAPVDLSMRMLKADKSALVAVDDAGTAEGTLAVKFPEDGTYYLEVKDLLKRGGPEFGYHISVTPQQPGFSLEAGTDAISLAAGNVAAVSVTVARIDYGGEITLTATGLPQGVTATPTTIGPGVNTGVMTLEAAPEFQGGQLSNIAIRGTGKVGETEISDVASVHDFLKGQWSSLVAFPQPLREAVGLSGAPAQKLRLRVEPALVEIKRGSKPTFKVTAERGEGVDEQITLATNPDKNAVPGNVGLAMKPIPKGQNEVELQFDSNDKSPLGTFSVVLTATHKKGNETITVSTPAISFRVVE
ncbi:MAG: PPC domain-containing protein [Planctomycetaceae bacterium]|nr:PPC domain-containing protein [Planctomycetaceae bacterium]